MLGFGAHHESRDVLDEQEWNALAIASVDEERDLFRAFGIDDSAKARLLARTSLDQSALISDQADPDALDAGIAADHFGGEVGLELVDAALVDDRREHGAHVVGHAMIAGKKIVQDRRVPMRRRAG
ncbi:hypothetical protein D3C83_34490 [compost metagenome]